MPQFRKTERITSLKEIEHLFERGHSSSIQAMPLHAVYQLRSAEQEETPVIKVLVSVAKKRLRHAVDRNR
ncbi:MAG: ribonuclease P protein component, partial [Bacteroidaceae bacterium]|nr:ribonuclease P protein component [Bacteroidaceae bacterium]